MDGSDVNSADRSPSGKLLAIGDDFGKVRLDAVSDNSVQIIVMMGNFCVLKK
jgi:hypothetical protein